MMADPIWYLGPAGNLRPLVCPEVNTDITTERYGGVFQGLSGYRSMDVTGHKQKFSFQFNYLDQAEYAWLEALHLRQFPGPFRLLNPMKKNRLTPESSLAKWGGGTAQGFTISSGLATQVWDWPATASPGFGLSSKWTNRTGGTSTLRFDPIRMTTVSAGEVITASVWLKTNTAFSPSVVVDWWDRTAQIGSSTVLVPSVTTSWQRFTITSTAPANTQRARFAMYTANLTSDLYIAAPQLEASATVTDWELGGAAPVVFVDQMPVATPRFPLRNATVTLLEA
jgi:hypothetical protein